MKIFRRLVAFFALSVGLMMTPTLTWAESPYRGSKISATDMGPDYSGWQLGLLGGGELQNNIWGGGAYLGYQKQMGQVVLGVEGDVMGFWNGNEGVQETGYGFTLTQLNYVASLRGKLGYVMNPFMVYVTGGWAWAGGNWATHCDPEDLLAGEAENSGRFTKTGWVLGGGVETQWTERATVRLEYLHYDFDGNIGDFNLGGPDIDVIRVGLGVRF